PGSGGAFAWAQLNSLPADGYTLMGINLPHIFLQPMSGDVGYRTEDIAPVYLFQATPHALVVTAGSPIASLEDFIRVARERPGGVTVAGTGLHTANHVAQQLFDRAAGIATRYVALTGTGATMEALLGKHVDAMWNFTTAGVELKGKVRLLAVAMGERHPLFPDVPTFDEKGIALRGGAERGVAVPKGVPAAIRARLSELFAAINHDPAYRKAMIDGGYVPIDIDHAALPVYMATCTEQFLGVADILGLRR
ncbi:MAG: tripartite tricarboxylate transporter substrate binding protein, partial [Alphaproteobacteria bacterium]|nr:tripartite tricarboxylate transporter substrate binding protein [Alphaproteobacteria bacterium]